MAVNGPHTSLSRGPDYFSLLHSPNPAALSTCNLFSPVSPPGCLIQPLRPEHAELVNGNWKYGGDADSYNSVRRYITHLPSLCVIPEDGSAAGTPVSWVLLYPHSALGLLYTLPEYRRRGYARALVSRFSEMLFEEGYPVYCFVEEGNSASCSLFQSIGFGDQESYRSVWFEFNERSK
ncbi:glycine N-acyltransferase-like [Sardina pilchardus]|uniref:glycine N-acyltransferase-like n=1 Tax=Sardina pilchardus TaxID=27697 RepID=UPI002E14A19C